ncbi:MAG TPA: DUF1800 domain-containing protein [Chiayiivirga sp.]|jgi:uncharacterized protein (DUF1800 family)|uniref:DUF1800 domain-containing protein n=1 Tax=Denitratimonas tolerans TaxID=1338420 RepID=A0AAW9R1P0_9GAMM|nr:DUF1800 domain-containing protein [Xanthomonadaceae bacterium]MDX9765431.1 DUF1800 domain-containing protein [Chiayiivirga sp.]HRN60281.1 DUF1800 domain-containing protein [Chiayiivirga sp.]HRO87267.1 DUF1800 domain-containing protein [Chiayiivirga sp.]HRQ35353.1 DUF1800 domain-containing protein [Chiayiivirga sp.]
METQPTPVPSGQPGDLIFADGLESPPPQVQLPPFGMRVLTRCAYGPRPNDVAAFNALGASDDARLTAWVNRQLDPDAIGDSVCDSRIAAAGYATANLTLAQMWATYVRGGQSGGNERYWPCDEAACLKLVRAVYSERQLYEVMVDFWHNHFNVTGWEYSIAPVFMHYDRDVMRGTHPTSGKRYALGNFRALLEEVAKAPAMLMFLDNKSSRGAGFNENFARELCELHTLGAAHYYPTIDPNEVPRDGSGVPLGYCDNDVYEAARALTGWTMRDDHWEFPDLPEYDTGEFLYHAPWHDKAGKYILGSYIIANRPAMADGRTLFDLLCRHVGTARNICRKLCRRFISDDPPEALVESAAQLWKAQWQAPDQIAQVLRHILNSSAFKTTWGEKTKRPWEVLMQAFRATSAVITPRPRTGTWNSYSELTSLFQQTGHGPFRWPTPDGYPDHSRKWQAVSPLSQTWRVLSRLPELRVPGGDENSPAAYFLRIEEVSRAQFPTPAAATAGAVVDFWIARLHGQPILPERRNEIVCFLGQKTDPVQAAGVQLTWDNAWNAGNLGRHYTIPRLRATVALIAMSPEFYQR